jgi:hypothetical protein
LRELVPIILADARNTEADRAEALAVALGDPDNALLSFRALAARAIERFSDTRRTCRQCANLSPQGRCLAAWRGERPWGALPGYSPVADLPQCCPSYRPEANDPDRRTGRERWPSLLKRVPQ